jgi:surface polysaccharide O-acyltransferase-like enzyme
MGQNNNDRSSGNTRLVYLDNLRSLVIILVILMHSAVTYSGIGGWYYKEGLQENLNIIEMTVFGILQSFTQAWFMGVLFFLSAFLASRSLVKRGPLGFVKERIFRLGIPLLFYMFIIAPFIYFVLLRDDPALRVSVLRDNYIQYLLTFRWTGSTGPLWFVEALLLFCAIYGIIRHFIPISEHDNTNRLKTKNIIYIILVTGVFAFLIRLYFPIGSSVLNLQFSFFASYTVLFIMGIISGERNWFDQISDDKNVIWFKAAFIIGIPLWSIIMLFGGALKGEMLIYGGLSWQSFAYALWESFVAIGFSVGIISFFKKHLNINNKFTQITAENAFGIYVFHAPILISVSLLLRTWIITPMIKFIIAAMLTFVICLLFSLLVRKIKPIKILLK